MNTKPQDIVDIHEDELPRPPRTEDIEDTTGGVESPPDRPRVPSTNQKEAIIGFIEYLLDHLSIKRIFLLGLAGIIGISVFLFYEHRNNIAQHLLSTTNISSGNPNNNITDWTLSDRSKEQIASFKSNHPILFVSVTGVDLKRNTKKIKYTDYNNTLLAPEVTRAIESDGNRIHALFDYDPNNTDQMVSVLDNKFRCDPFVDTVYYKVSPESSGRISTICRIAIPPFVGQFVGFISIGLVGEVSQQEMESLRLKLTHTAMEIYLRDVSHLETTKG